MARFTGKQYGQGSPIGQELYADFEELRAARVAMDAEIRRWAATLMEETVNAPSASSIR